LKQFNFWQNFKPKFLHTWDQTSKKFIMQGGNDSKKVSVKNNLHEFELGSPHCYFRIIAALHDEFF
jgi:hypothetical protein